MTQFYYSAVHHFQVTKTKCIAQKYCLGIKLCLTYLTTIISKVIVNNTISIYY